MVDYLKQVTKITDAQLDARIPDDKLWELAGVLGNHELYVGVPGFDLNEADKTDLNVKATKNGNQFAMKEAFEKWFDESPSVVTYRSLVLILIELRKKKLAEKVCQTVVKSGPKSTEVNPSVPTPGPTSSIPSSTVPADVILTVDHIERIFEIVLNAEDKYYYIGKGIGVSDATMKEIEDRHLPDKMRCINEILKRRIRGGGLTRSMLCNTLRKPTIKRDDLAKEIEALKM